MSCNCEGQQCTGAGASLLPFPSLQYILTSEKMLGSHSAEVADGPVNRELHKLLMNICAVSAFVKNYFSRTFGFVDSAAPAVDTIPDPLQSAPSSPASGVIHTVYYTNFEVTYQWDGTEGEWIEVGRQARVGTLMTLYRRVLEIDVADDEDNIALEIPTLDDNDVAVAFTIEDLKNFYVKNLDADSPVVGAVAGINDEGEGALRIMLTSAPEEGSNYKLMAVFEKLVIV